MKHYEVAGMSVLERGKIKTVYVLIMIYDSYVHARNSILLTPDNLPRKMTVANSVGLDTIVLTNHLKKNYGSLILNQPLSCSKTHYIFNTEEDAKKAADYLNDCLLAKEMIK